ncbi:LuxR C-terminal-related transcriptional regulator [Streptomyces asiaticus]
MGERAFISENTVKQHLKRIFAKTDVSSRAELVQLMWSAGT